ncbi:MAG: TrkA C-terminal domain-containing protein [Candidatus Tantalella remota]|nr:TrkA C-terminal domain-containing protein [Candidatus Tantalella remota]
MSFILVIPVIVIILISVFIVKIASVALNLTGIDQKTAFFQALSAFTGTGFTTRESEIITSNDIRRKIIMLLMILGNAGLITVISTLMLSMLKGGMNLTPVLVNISIILVVILLVIKVSQHKGLGRALTRKIQENLIKSPTFTKRPVEEILHLAEGYGIAEVTLDEKCIDIGKKLDGSSFRENDILVLAIERGSSVVPAPNADDELNPGDTLICYGKLENIAKIGKRKKDVASKE